MEVAISYRNQNSTSPHAVGAASLILGGLVRIDGRRELKGGCFPSARYGCFFPAQQQRNESNRPKPGKAARGSGGTHCDEPNGTGGNTHRRSRGSRNREWRPLPFALSLSKPVLRAHEGPVLRGLPRSLSPRSRGTPPALSLASKPLRKQRVVVIVQGSAVRAGSGGRRGSARPAPHEGVIARPSASDDRQD